ncbi:hypothetical protein [Aeromonas caviae]|uniref:Uncharacterized protein n=1 Tax=Aeromonas caviae TaxID=648 RepID=A0AAJ6CTZ1_AERCA|nr:hypothetical protein [Aeromonas caviae]RWT81312.1 hypothetical protein DN604_00660 [Aeromonas caviae]WFG00371.1 hypothetical protein P5S46_21650 [Aeromonas caviae]
MDLENMLTEQEHDDLDAFLVTVLQAFKKDEITQEKAVGSLNHLIAAMDNDEYDEVRSCLRNREEFVRS